MRRVIQTLRDDLRPGAERGRLDAQIAAPESTMATQPAYALDGH